MIESELITKVQREIKGLSSEFDSDDYADAVDNAENETGWTLPITDTTKIFWICSRVKRHLYATLRDSSAHKFQYKQIHLEHRFKNWHNLLKQLDDDFEKAKEENPELFAGVDAHHLLGSKIEPGFVYEPQSGRDVTYYDDYEVTITPDDS